DGAHLREPFDGRISFEAARVAATGVPDSPATVLAAGRPVTASVTVTNTGLTPKAFFVDPRLKRRDLLPLLTQGATNVALPLSLVTQPRFAVPTLSDRLIVAAQGTVPIVMDVRTGFGDPDRLGEIGRASCRER